MAEDNTIDIIPMVRHRLLLDILSDDKVNDYWDATKLVPPSPDVLKIMQAESHRRLDSIAGLQQFIEPYIVLVGDLITSIMFQDVCTKSAVDVNSDEEVVGEFRAALTEQNRETLRAAIYPIMASMLETRVLSLGDVAKAYM